MADLPDWAYSYLRFLGLAPAAPSLGVLAHLLRAHLHRIPFENISKLYYFRRLADLGWKVPPSETWVENVVTRNFGGTCFTINSTFYRLLTLLGYDTRLMRVAGGGHLSVGVRLDDRLYLVDPALGVPLFEPADLLKPTVIDWCGRGMRIFPMNGERGAYHMEHYTDGERKHSWTFSSMPESWDQFEANIDYSYSATGFFMVFLSCSLYQAEPKRNLSLLNNVFTARYANGNRTVTNLGSVEHFEEVLATEFRLPGLPVREAIETLKALGVDVFAPSTHEE